jgi:hypothetical protein
MMGSNLVPWVKLAGHVLDPFPLPEMQAETMSPTSWHVVLGSFARGENMIWVVYTVGDLGVRGVSTGGDMSAEELGCDQAMGRVKRADLLLVDIQFVLDQLHFKILGGIEKWKRWKI